MVILGIQLLPFPILCAWILMKNKKRINEPDFREKYGTLVNCLRPKQKTLQLLSFPIFLYRRIALALIPAIFLPRQTL
jgi:hypothetical protein